MAVGIYDDPVVRDDLFYRGHVILDHGTSKFRFEF